MRIRPNDTIGPVDTDGSGGPTYEADSDSLVMGNDPEHPSETPRLFLVEAYVPRAGVEESRASAARLGTAIDEYSGSDASLRYIRTTFLPDDETCFHLVEAASADVVREIGDRAGLGRIRVVEGVDTSHLNGESRT